MFKKLSLVTVLALAMGSSALAAGGMSARGAKKFGIMGYYGVLPSVVGGELGYHLGSLARIQAGYLMAGTTGRITGAFKLFVPSWNFSPTVGIRANYALTGGAITLSGEGGLEWQTMKGFNLGAGVQYSLSTTPAIMGYYATIGWFFGKGK